MTRELISNIKPSVPCIELYDPLKGDDFGGNVYAIEWDGVHFNTSDFIYLNDGTIKINTTGIYLFDTNIGLQHTGTNVHYNILLYLTINGDTNTDIYSRGKIHCIGTGVTDYVQLSLTRILYLKKDDVIQMRYSVENTGTSLSSNLSSLQLTYIPMGGFNNGQGGNIIDRGIRR
jgi:hypothetical protein